MAKLINWELFEQGSSVRAAIIDVASGDCKSYNDLLDILWPKDCKEEINKIRKNRSFKKFKIMARNWCTRNGYDYTCPCCGR